jgi:hypothetical protein
MCLPTLQVSTSTAIAPVQSAAPSLCALGWHDLELTDGRSLLVRCGKGGKPRRQPVPAARELQRLRNSRRPDLSGPVFCGLAG